MILLEFPKKARDSYSHIPEYKTIMVGLGIGVLRVATSRLCINSLPWLNKLLKPAPMKLTPAALIPIASSLTAPFGEEPLFRGHLSKESKYHILLANAVVFGALHGLISGSPEWRISRVFMSTIGGLYYCAAQSITGDLWAPTIAHLTYNAFSLADALTRN